MRNKIILHMPVTAGGNDELLLQDFRGRLEKDEKVFQYSRLTDFFVEAINTSESCHLFPYEHDRDKWLQQSNIYGRLDSGRNRVFFITFGLYTYSLLDIKNTMLGTANLRRFRSADTNDKAINIGAEIGAIGYWNR